MTTSVTVWYIAGVGANIISAVFEPNCKLLVGASGAVFGFFGLFLADLVVNFESTSRLLMRFLCVVLFTEFFIVNVAIEGSTQGVSHASHVGGLVCGLFPSLLFLPNIRNKRIRALKKHLDNRLGPAADATSMCVVQLSSLRPPAELSCSRTALVAVCLPPRWYCY